jgi:hypothetical protein
VRKWQAKNMKRERMRESQHFQAQNPSKQWFYNHAGWKMVDVISLTVITLKPLCLSSSPTASSHKKVPNYTKIWNVATLVSWGMHLPKLHNWWQCTEVSETTFGKKHLVELHNEWKSNEVKTFKAITKLMKIWENWWYN